MLKISWNSPAVGGSEESLVDMPEDDEEVEKSWKR